MPAEFQYLLVVAAIFALLLLAGVPGREPEQVGERTGNTPQREWATRWSAQVQTEQAAPVEPPRDATPQR